MASSSEDVLVVAADWAWGVYLRHSLYCCQVRRRFREDVSRMGFYSHNRLHTHFPVILARRDDLRLTEETADGLEDEGRDGARFARAIRELRRAGTVGHNWHNQLFLLTAPDDSRTLVLTAEIVNRTTSAAGRRVAWTPGHRYTSEQALRQNPPDTDRLAALGG